MKIALTVTLDVDPEVWAAEYGLDAGPAGLAQTVRDDARAHLANTVHEHYVTDLGIARDSVVRSATRYRAAGGLR
jgi:hypothetical protein